MSDRDPHCRHGALREECELCRPFRDLAARRTERGIRLKRICFMAEASQVEAFNILWESWVERWGKTKAVDHLLVLVARAEARIRDQEQCKTEKRKENADT